VSGPVAVLLTNVEGFAGRVVMETRSAANKVGVVSGELLGRRGKLLFVPEAGASGRRGARLGGFSFVWDVANNSGYLLSEALQGYAPIASDRRFTNVIAKAAAGASTPERAEGHWCEQQEFVAASSEGATVELRVWRAADLKGFPVRINWATDSTSCAVSFSKLQLEAPPGELFLPPDAFTKYESAEAMMNELLLRQQGGRRGFPGGAGGLEREGGRRGHPPRGGR
jgi:hypothetical protein